MKNFFRATKLASITHRRVFALLGMAAITLALMPAPRSAWATDQMSFKASAGLINSAAPTSLAKKNQVPIKGSYNTVIESFVPIEFVGGVPVKFAMHITKTGRVSHLGNFTGTIDQIADYVNFTITGTSTFVAANRDELYATHSGTFRVVDTAGNVEFAGSLIFTGGTGRFSDATGAVQFTGTASPATATGHVDLRGTIAY